MASMEDIPLLEDVQLSVDDEPNGLQIVLLGKTGSGKSSLANTIFGGVAEFNVSHSAGSETKVCQTKTDTVNERKIRMIDTPGLFDTEEDNTQLSSEDLKFLIDCAPGVHAFLVLLKVEKYSLHERNVTDSIFKQFTKEALKYSTIIFTHGDQLPDEITIESWVEENAKVKSLVQKCGGRCHVFDNKYWNNNNHPYRNNQVQMKKLLETIEETVTKNGGRYYTNDLLQKIEKEIRLEQANASSPGDDPQTARNKAKGRVHDKLWPRIKGAVIGTATGALVGGGAVALGVFLFPGVVTGVALVGVASGVTAVSGAVGGLAGQKVQEATEKKNN